MLISEVHQLPLQAFSWILAETLQIFHKYRIIKLAMCILMELHVLALDVSTKIK